jgi:hypothetical protein
MQDLWRVRDADVTMQDLDNLVEYHRFLKRFKVVEEERRRKDLLYDGKRFGSPAGKSKEC